MFTKFELLPNNEEDKYFVLVPAKATVVKILLSLILLYIINPCRPINLFVAYTKI